MQNTAPNFSIHQKNNSENPVYFTTKEEVLGKIAELAKNPSFNKRDIKVIDLDYGTVLNFYIDYKNGIDVFFGS